MIASVRGSIEAKGTGYVVVLVGGFGVRVLVPSSVLADLGDPGDHVHLLTHLQVREDALTLYGFASPAQLRLFELLTSITGVGPGHALGVLGLGDPDAVETAIAIGNEAYIAQAPRLGKKLAARVVLELRNKVSQRDGVGGVATAQAPDAEELLAALTALGYSPGEAYAAAAALPNDPALSLEDKIRLALAHFSRV